MAAHTCKSSPREVWDVLSVFSLDVKDFNSGRCRLGELSMQNAGVLANHSVCLTFREHHIKVFCRVWPVVNFTPPDDFLQVDASVVSSTSGKEPDLISLNGCRLHLRDDINVVESCVAKFVNVTVFAESQRKNKTEPSPRLFYDKRRRQSQVRCILQGKVFTRHCWVYVRKLENCGVGFIEEIERIFINDIDHNEQGEGGCNTSDQVVMIGPGTEVIVQAIKLPSTNTQAPFSLAGYGVIANQIDQAVFLPLNAPRSCDELGVGYPQAFLLIGPPGVGKTSLVKHLAEKWGAEMFLINGGDIYGPHMGESESNLRNIFNTASEASKYVPCVVFIDEIDAVCPKRSQGSDVECRVASQLLTLIDKMKHNTRNMILIAATNRPNALDAAVRRPGRFDKEFVIGVPSSLERLEILKHLTQALPLSEDVKLDKLAEQCLGYVAADLTSLVRQAATNAVKASLTVCKDTATNTDQTTSITANDFKTAFKEIVPSTYRGMDGLVESTPIQWEDIGGYEHVKQVLRQAVEWPFLYPDAFSRLGLSRPRGILLYGPPGCSKTTLVQAAATSCHCTFLSLSCAQLYSPYVGDAERLIREVFTKARAAAPTILFLDEVDAVVRKRSCDGSTGVEARILSTLLNEMDGVGVSNNVYETESGNREEQGASNHCLQKGILFVAATNRPDVLDEAIVRPGRIDRVIHVPHPDKETRLDILKIYCRKIPLEDDVDLSTIAEQTEIFSGADLKNLCREASLNALQDHGVETCCRVSQGHFIQALSGLAPSLTQAQINAYNNMMFS